MRHRRGSWAGPPACWPSTSRLPMRPTRWRRCSWSARAARAKSRARERASRTIKVDLRVVAATNVPVEQAVTAQRFRRDLYYRLGVVTIQLPSLRDRREDIPLLVEQFLRNATGRTHRQVTIAPAALDALT